MHEIANQFKHIEKETYFPSFLMELLKSNWNTQDNCSSIINTFPWSRTGYTWSTTEHQLIAKFGTLDKPFDDVQAYAFKHYSKDKYPEFYI